MYHKVILVGNLGRDPESGNSPSGKPVTHFSVATSERWTGSDGNTQERRVWWRVSAFGVLGKTCHEHLKVGHRVLVEGTLNADPSTGAPPVWLAHDGKPRASFELRAQVVKFLGSSKAENGQHATTDPSKDEVPF